MPNDSDGTVMLMRMSTKPLTSTSYLVLGLIERCQPATVYDLKQLATVSVFNFWALPHTVLYTETERLAGKGLLDRHQETGGRRRRTYRLTDAGLDALNAWRAEPTSEVAEIRDLAVLKLFCGSDPEALGEAQREAHQAKLDEYLELREELVKLDTPRGVRLALDAGIAVERELVRYWSAVAEGADDPRV